ncbi:GIY-YIG nuclease family protein [uncultured Nostoc sp.]|uniref:GIY-YIG nuclease family protein n=1 Tax=uncultured Nostoc sp. TaxID=340711 RepID=UPI002620714F|nr:GIY-YIG nuclease family protein [uncultured Nostoc sp.]
MNFDEIPAIIYQSKNDHEPGFIYLMEAEGYHGLIPGVWLRRCKIGLSRNPSARLDAFHRNQPPCNVKILKTIYVEDMADVESKLHQQFKQCNIELIRSQEWFDFNPVQFMMVNWEFEKRSLYVFSLSELPIKLIIFSMIGLVGVGTVAGRLTSQPANSVIQPQGQFRK